jgi:hypothetical protein
MFMIEYIKFTSPQSAHVETREPEENQAIPQEEIMQEAPQEPEAAPTLPTPMQVLRPKWAHGFVVGPDGVARCIAIPIEE